MPSPAPSPNPIIFNEIEDILAEIIKDKEKNIQVAPKDR